MPRKKPTPAEIATKVDAFKEYQTKRLELQRELELMKDNERMLKTELIELLKDAKVTGITGRLAHVELVEKTVPVVKDWDALYEHIKETGSFELLHRRLTERAVMERWELGDEVPGVASDSFYDLSVTKPKVRKS